MTHAKLVPAIDRSKLKIYDPIPEEEHYTPAEKKNAEALSQLAQSVPSLPLEPVELAISGWPSSIPVGTGQPGVDDQGNLYFALRTPTDGADTVLVFNRQGQFLRSFGKGPNRIYQHSIKIDLDGNVWVPDAHTSIVTKYSPGGKELMVIDVGEVPDPTIFNAGATDIDFGKSGNIYICDGYINARVLEYTRDGKRIRSWGSHGSGRGEFDLPHSMAIGPDGTIYVADRSNGRLQWYDENGTQLGERLFGGLVGSVRVAPKTGEVYVAAGNFFDPKVNFQRYMANLFIFRFDPKTERVLGKIAYPVHQFAITADGALFIGLTKREPGDNAAPTFTLFVPKAHA